MRKLLIPACTVLAILGACLAYLGKPLVKAPRSLASAASVSSESILNESELKALQELRKNEDSVGMRQWLLKTGAEKSFQLLISLDNNSDKFSKLRFFALGAIASFRHEGLDDHARANWAISLRKLAMGSLNDGPTRADFLGQSYLMEGNLAEARKQYATLREYPKNSAERERAEWFFKTYDQQNNYDAERAPASPFSKGN